MNEKMEEEINGFSIKAIIWLMVSIFFQFACTFANRLLFKYAGLMLPITLSFVHMIVCTLLSHLVIKTKIIKVEIPIMSKRQTNNAFILSVIWSLSVALASSSLSLIDVGLFTVVKCAVPAWSALMSFLILNKRVDTKIIISLVFLVLGPIFSSYADINLTLLGAIITNSVNLFTALKITLSTKIFSESDAWEPIFLLSVMSPRAALFLLPLTVSEVYYHAQTVPISVLFN
eukprot:TRINITY_DN11260_c0_g1_i1.p1 TRINITY_DN11260_c0_g1~~TRINITY_DN11260_c0_g1_i1.p1  ORF type:complete len:231 (-),score=15.64 TRINITY_DN11260_c0_g1_i1:26-718(-)